MKHFIYFLLFLFIAQYLLADDVEEIVVTSSLIDEKLSDVGEPVHVLSGVDLDAQGRASLGESIDSLLGCLLYTSPSPRDKRQSRMPSSA